MRKSFGIPAFELKTKRSHGAGASLTDMSVAPPDFSTPPPKVARLSLSPSRRRQLAYQPSPSAQSNDTTGIESPNSPALSLSFSASKSPRLTFKTKVRWIFYIFVCIFYFLKAFADISTRVSDPEPDSGAFWIRVRTRLIWIQGLKNRSKMSNNCTFYKIVVFNRLRSMIKRYNQCCGSKYVEFGSGSKILAQFGSGSRSGSRVIQSILKEKIIFYETSTGIFFLTFKNKLSPKEIFDQLGL